MNDEHTGPIKRSVASIFLKYKGSGHYQVKYFLRTFSRTEGNHTWFKLWINFVVISILNKLDGPYKFWWRHTGHVIWKYKTKGNLDFVEARVYKVSFNLVAFYNVSKYFIKQPRFHKELF